MDRKEFIKTCCLVCVAGTGLATLLQSCGSANYFAPYTISSNQMIIKKSEFIKIGNDKQILRKHVLIQSEKFSFPICIFKIEEEKYSALLMQCTHKGCELQPHGDYLVCPCHGSEFTNRGTVQNPPAEQSLQSFNIITDNENIYVIL